MDSNKEYFNWISSLKERIRTAQIKAAVSVNVEMIALYWDIGRTIVEKQEYSNWGAGLIKQMAKDLKKELPEVSGFSQANLYVMRQFFLFYHNSKIVQQVAVKLDNANEIPQNEILQQAAVILNHN